jgi:hypothetical protein
MTGEKRPLFIEVLSFIVIYYNEAKVAGYKAEGYRHPPYAG